MFIYTSKECQEWEDFTLEDQSMFTYDLMERASKRLAEKILDIYPDLDLHFYIFVGPGNNGGDGLVIARILRNQYRDVSVVVLQNKGTPEYEQNFALIRNKSGIKTYNLTEFENLTLKTGVIIDAIFGYGTNRAPEGNYEKAISFINKSAFPKISIDLPSGMVIEALPEWPMVKSDHTLMIQNVKLTSLFPEGGAFYGKCHMVDIGLSKKFEAIHPTKNIYITNQLVKTILKSRAKFSHKGNFGHAALACGSEGMIGAAILSVKSCLRSGVGLTTSFVPECGYDIMQISCPEAMCVNDMSDRHLKNLVIPSKFDAVGIGCGIGTNPDTVEWLEKTLKNLSTNRIVLDADALNIISENKIKIPKGAIITPHPREFDRLFGVSKTGLERYNRQIEVAQKLKINIILKGHHTSYTNSNGETWFNSTGNPGMACGGSGDVLTGLIVGLLAQEYTVDESCILAIYLHGLAGDHAAQNFSEEAMTSADIISFMGKAWKQIKALNENGTNIEK